MSEWRSAPRSHPPATGNQGKTYRRPYPHSGDRDHPPQASGYGGGPRTGRKNLGKRFGLFGFSERDRRKLSIPLKSVAVEATVLDFLVQVDITQQFVNNEDNPIETTYTFPIAPNSAVCGFSAEIEGKKIVAQVKETEEAKDAYDDAISSGHGAYLGQEERPSVFTVTVGNLPPGKEATIRIVYVAELRLVGNKKKTKKDNQPHLLPFEDTEQRLKFSLPSRLAPKAKKKQNAYGTPAVNYTRFPEYKLTINVNLKTSGAITGFTSSQPIGLQFLSSNETKLWLSPLIKALKHDFTLLVSLTEQQKTQSYVLVEAPDAEGGSYAVAVILYPKQLLATAKPEEKEATPQPVAAEEKPMDAAATEAPVDKEKEKESEDKPGTAQTPAAPEGATGAESKPKRDAVSVTDLSWEWPAGVVVPTTSLPPSVHVTRGFLLAYGLVPASAFGEAGVVTAVLKGKSTSGPVTLALEISNKDAVKGNLIHRLFARAKIRDLERGLKDKPEEEKKAEVVALATRYSLASQYTSFVAVEERTEATEGTMVSRVVPLNAFGYGEQARPGRGRGRGGREHDTRDDRRRQAAQHGQPYGHHYKQHHEDRESGGGREYGGRESRDYRGARSEDSYARGRDWGDRGERDQRGPRTRPAQRPRLLEVSADLVERLVAVKAKDSPHWYLTSTISDILGVQLSKLVDGMIGVPVSDYASNIWATAIVVACIRAHEEASKKYAELTAQAEKWMTAQTERHGLDKPEVWIRKARDCLSLLLV